MPYEVLDRDGFVTVEPALALTRDKFVGALRLPGDETGDCFKFTNALAELATALGVRFRYDSPHRGARRAGRQAHRRAHRAGQTLRADARRAGAGQPLGADAAARWACASRSIR